MLHKLADFAVLARQKLNPHPNMPLSKSDKETLRQHLCALQRFMLDAILEQRERNSVEQMAAISEETAADTIYAIDRVSETAIHNWFRDNWPSRWPVEIVMEGLEDGGTLTFPENTPVESTMLKCIIDPIDGTRGIMYDKRSAWILIGIAPQNGEATTLDEIDVAAMTEIPTTRQWRCDQISAVRGGGVQSVAYDIRNAFRSRKVTLRPSQAHEVRHAFGTVSRFFPAGSALLSEFEERLWATLYGDPKTPSPLIFNDQYISTGGQFYEILAGHDRFIADLRPLAFRKLGIESNLACHPYDVATALLLEEAGAVIEQPDGSPLNCPLDTTTAVSWVAYANPNLANAIRPTLQKLVEELLT